MLWNALMLNALLTCSSVFSQETPPKQLQYRRIFVPSENLPLLGSDFVPIKVEELKQLIESHREQPKPPLDHSTPVLSQAMLVASLVETNLVSNASRITISCQSETPRLYTLYPSSLAVRPTSASQQELAESIRQGIILESQPFRYDSQGQPTIAVKEPTDFWFGWSLRGQPSQDVSRLQFQLDVPQCLDSRLMLKLPPMWRVESKSSVVRPCANPRDILGANWPSSVDIDGEPDSENWWLVELSGSSSVTFDLVQSVEAFQLKFDRFVSRERIDYRLLPGTLEVNAEFQLSSWSDASSNLTIRVAPSVHVSSVTLDEEPLEWQPSRLPFCIDVLYGDELGDRDASSSRQLVVRGLAAWPLTDEPKELPTIQIEKAYSIDGVGSLSIHQDWVVNQLSVDNGHVFSRSGTTQLGGLGRCDFEWTGRSPKILLQATPRARQGRTETWTRLSNDNDGLVATSWVSFGANASPRSSLRMALSPGWAIESVQSIERRFTTTLHRAPNTDSSEWQLQIAPAVENQAITFEIRTRNNTLTKSDVANAATLVFDGERPITFHDFKQSDLYWIEPTGRYKVDATTELLQCQFDSSTLTESQRQRLPRIGEVRLMKLDGSRIPRLTFRRQPAPFTAQLDTTIEPSLHGVSAHYRLKCVPLAGAVSSVAIDVQHSEDVPIRWRQRRSTAESDDGWTPVESINVRRDNPKNSKNLKKSIRSAPAVRTIQINLPAATSEAFELEGFADFRNASNEQITLQVPLLSLPEAAQKDATLQVDERLSLAQSTGNNPWTPLGYIRFKPNSEAYRFRYDPIQLATIDIQLKPTHHLPGVWMDDVVWQYRRYLDGKTECEIQAKLFSNEASAIGFNVQSGWRLRIASLDGHVSDAIETTDDANQVHLWIPQHVSSQASAQLSLIFDGPSSILHHREQIGFPTIEPTCDVLNQRFEWWLPSAMSIHVSAPRSQLGFPSIKWDKLLPSGWYRLLLASNAPNANKTQSEDRGSRHDKHESDLSQLGLALSTERVDDIRTNAISLTVAARESKQAEDWVMVFAGFALSLCLAHLRKSHLAIVGLILAAGIVAANGRLLEAIQLVALGWIVSVVLVVVNACYKQKERTVDRAFQASNGGQITRSLHARKERYSFSRTRSKFTAFWIGWAMAMPLAWFAAKPAMAQSQPEKVYHVVLPIDSNSELTSEVAYVSEELLQELYQRKQTQEIATQFLSARYELQLVESEPRNGNSTVRLTLNYEIDVRDHRRPVSLPLRAEQARFVALLVDGSEIPLGSRLRWDEQVLQWTPPNRGLTQIELTLDANCSRDAAGRSMIELDVTPFAGARLDIESTEAIEIQCDAMGEVLAPEAGILRAAIGPMNKLKVSWRKPDREQRVVIPTTIVESEFGLIGEAILARTKIDVLDASSGTDRFDLECDAAWQPLGRRWGNATLLDSIPSSSNTRRRFRLRWEDSGSIDQGSRSIVIHWAASNAGATLMNLPEVELLGTRVQESLLRFVRQKDSAWQIEGLQSWTKVDTDASRFTWLPRASGEVVAFRKPSNAPSAFLRRVTKIEPSPVTLDSHLRFLSNVVHCKTTITLNQQEHYGPDVRLTLPADVIVKSVQANQIEIPFSILRLDEKHVQLQAFLDPESDALGIIVIESTQSYQESVWMRLPLPRMDTYPVADHWVSATRIVGQSIEWDGIATLPQESQPLPTTRLDMNKQSLEVEAWSNRLNLVAPVKPDTTLGQDASPKLVEETEPGYRVLRRSESNQGYVVSELSRIDEHWSYHVHGLVEAGTTPIDGVLMEMPSSIWDSLQCSHRTTRFESPETNRLLVYIFSDKPSSKEPFEFNLTSRLPPSESNATTELPEVRMLGHYEWRQWLIVPRSIANQEARWNFSGARSVDASTVPDFALSDSPDLDKESLVVVPTTDRPNVRLSNVAANPLPITLNLAVHEAAIDATASRRMRSSFFLFPRGQLSILFRIPSYRKLLAVECNGHRVPMSSILLETNDESLSQFNIRLASSSLPQKVTLHTTGHRDGNATESHWSSFPEVVDASPAKSLLIIDSPHGVVSHGSEAIDIDRARQLLASSIVAVTEQASGFIAESSLTERRQWWKDWEEATSSIWNEASLIQSHEFLNAISARRHSLYERLQLRSLSQPQPTTRPLAQPVALEQDDFIQSDLSREVRQHFLVDSEINSTSSLKVDPTIPKKVNWLDSNVWFGWSLWLVTTVFALRYTQIHFDQWMISFKQFFLHRPWWLFAAIGALAFSLAPGLWYGPGFILLSLYFVLRTYWHEVRHPT